LYRRLH